MKIDQTDHIADNQRRQSLIAAGGLLGALAASSCCILPLAMFGRGFSGAWIGNFTRLAPYQPYFLAATLAFLGRGYWLVYRSGARACAHGGNSGGPGRTASSKPASSWPPCLSLSALGLDFLAPLFLNS